MFGLRRMALAIAILCFWPPEICDPFGPTVLSKACQNYLLFCASLKSIYYYILVDVF